MRLEDNRAMILLIGASASGKSEIAKALAADYHITKAITHTTRGMRVNERQDIDYHFVDVPTFLAMKENGEFVETTFYNGNYYGCSKKEMAIDKAVVVDPQGLLNFRATGEKSLVAFLLLASKATRYERMKGRGDDEAAILKRLEGDDKVFAIDAIAPCDFVIDTEGKTVSELTKTVYECYLQQLKKINASV